MSKITKDMTLGDVVSRYPEAAEVMLRYGLHCIGCHVAAFETIEQGALSHGMDKKQIDKMLKEMNETANKPKTEKCSRE